MRQHAYILGLLASGEEAPFGHRPGTDIRPGRGRRYDKSTKRLSFVLDRSRDEHERSDFVDAWKHGESIQVLPGKGRDAEQRERVWLRVLVKLAGHDEDQVGPESLDLIGDFFLHSLTDRHEQRHRPDTDDDPNHGKGCPEPASPKRA